MLQRNRAGLESAMEIESERIVQSKLKRIPQYMVHKEQRGLTAKVLISAVDNSDCALAKVKLILLFNSFAPREFTSRQVADINTFTYDHVLT